MKKKIFLFFSAAAWIFFPTSPAVAEPWFNMEEGRPVYLKEHPPGLSADYGRVGKGGLVWYASFDGSLEAEYAEPDNPGDILTVEAVFGGWRQRPAELDPDPAGVQFTDGVRGQAFYAPAGERKATADFPGLNAVTPLERGTFVLWMRSDDGSLFSDTFNIFQSGAANLRHGTWAPHHLALQDAGTFPTQSYFTGALTNDLKGWNMFAYTWNTESMRFYANGIFISEHPIPQGTRPWNHLSIGRVGAQAGRAYDEIAFYDRILSQSELRRQYLALLAPMHDNVLSVPFSATPVEPDGIIGEAEWQDALLIKGFLEGSPAGDFGSGQLSEPQAELYLKYDKTNLYIACRSPWPPDILEARIMTTALSGALASVAGEGEEVDPSVEDAFEIMVSAPGAMEDEVYRLLINPLNIVSDGVIHGREIRDAVVTDFSGSSGWNAVTRDAVEGEWLFEAVIPFESIGVEPRPGKEIEFNIARHWQMLKKGSESWHWGRRIADRQDASVNDTRGFIPMGRLRLAGEGAPFVRVLSLGELMRGELDFHAEITNPGVRDTEVNLSLRTHTIDSGRFAPGFLIVSEKIAIPAGESRAFRHSRAIEDYGKNMLVFDARAEGAREPLARNAWHFIREETLDIYVKKFPSAGKAAVMIDCGLLAEYSPSQLTALITVKDNEEKEYIRLLSDPFNTYTETVSVDMSGLVYGDYILDIRILAGDEAVAMHQQHYIHNPLPAWLGNEYGWNFDTVPSQFSPVGRNGNMLSAWHRDYDFGTGLLPEQITTQGWEILREPLNIAMTLSDGRVISTAGAAGEISWNDSPQISVVRQSGGELREVKKEVSGNLRREGSSVVRIGDISVRNDFWFEYDGLLWNTISIESDDDIYVKEMFIEVNLTEFFSRDIYPGGALTEGGSNRILQWLGNGYGGIQPIVRTSPAGHLSAEIQLLPDGAAYRMKLVNEEIRLSDLKPLEFSLQATPVKSRYPEYRRKVWFMEGSPVYWDIYAWYPPDQVFVPAPDNYYDQMTHSYRDDGAKYGDLYLRNRRFAFAENFKPAPVIYRAAYFTGRLNVNVPEAVDFKDEWLASPRGDEKVSPGATTISIAASALSVRDYYLWRHGRLMDKIPYGSMYFDTQVYGGQVHSLLDRAPGTTHPLLGAREIAQRLYHLVKLPFPDGIMFDHGPGSVDMALKSFTDFEIDGEQLWPRHYEGMANFKGVMSLDYYRVKFMGLNYGRVGNWDVKLGNKAFLTRQAQRAAGTAGSIAEHAQSIKLLHDSSQHLWRYGTVGEYNVRLKNALEKHGWGSDYLMMPYWDQQVAELPEDMYASFYVNPEAGAPAPETIDTAGYYLRTMQGSSSAKVICIFSNESDWEGEMRVRLDWEKLGFDGSTGLRAENAVHGERVVYTLPEGENFTNDGILPEGWFRYEKDPGEYVRIENGELVFPMTGWNYRMIVLEQK